MAAGVTAKLTAPGASVQHHIVFLGMVLVVLVIDMDLLMARVMDVDVFIFYLHDITLMGGFELDAQRREDLRPALAVRPLGRPQHLIGKHVGPKFIGMAMQPRRHPNMAERGTGAV